MVVRYFRPVWCLPLLFAVCDSWPATLSGSPAPSIVLLHPSAGRPLVNTSEIFLEALVEDAGDRAVAVEFFRDGAFLGRTEAGSGSDTSGGRFGFRWSGVLPGDYQLTARAVRASGVEQLSAPVRVLVQWSAPTLVSVSASDESAREPSPGGIPVDLGRFILRRAGPTNESLSVSVSWGGTAIRGRDYVLVEAEELLFPPGSASLEVSVQPVEDSQTEKEETVRLTLQIGSGYAVEGSPSATLSIVDSTGRVNGLPTIELIQPMPGTSFRPYEEIILDTRVLDRDGFVKEVEFFANETSLARVTEPPFRFAWTNAPLGTHWVYARAVDNYDAAAESRLVQVVVAAVPGDPFVDRELGEYAVGGNLVIILTAVPVPGTSAYAIEEQIPEGWEVPVISHDGVFDPINRKVKFGPFYDDETRRLVYELKPPGDSLTWTGEIEGTATGGEIVTRVVGELVISVVRQHPADRQPYDGFLVLSEVVAYAAAWKRGETWPLRPSPIPVAYVTRAGFLWQKGEAYKVDLLAGPPPVWWVPDPSRTNSTMALNARLSPEAEPAVREITHSEDLSHPVRVEIHLRPPVGTTAQALEEKPPRGWTVSDVSDAGVYDPSSGVIRWGLFLDNLPRVVSYSILRSASGDGTPPAFTGSVSFDGVDHPVGGDQGFSDARDAAPPEIRSLFRTDEGRWVLDCSGAGGWTYLLQGSDDLSTWETVGSAEPEGDRFQLEVDAPSGAARRFYRLLGTAPREEAE